MVVMVQDGGHGLRWHNVNHLNLYRLQKREFLPHWNGKLSLRTQTVFSRAESNEALLKDQFISHLENVLTSLTNATYSSTKSSC